MATGNSRNSTWGSEFVRADLDWRFRVASLVLPRLIHLQTTPNGCQSRERQKTERLRLRQSPQNRLGVLVSVWTYQLPVYRHYENSLHVASKEGSRIRHMPTFGLINRSYIRCFRRTHKVCLVITNYTRGIPGSSPTQKSTSKQLYNWLGGKSILRGTARSRSEVTQSFVPR